MPKIILNKVEYCGGDDYVELTQAEYDALTPAQRNNGTVYYITDANSNNGTKFQPIIYSEAERVVGCWTDGKPLYQKTFYLTQTTNTEDPLIADISGLNIDTVVYCNGVCKNSSNYIIPLPYAHYANQYDMTPLINDLKTRLELRLGSGNRPAYDVYVTIQYTKATDAPGSGYWTPQGVPAQHYSTEEQIVGTWIDGSTVYKKVFTNLSVATNGISWVHISSIDTTTWGEVLDCKIYRKMNNKYTAIPIAEYSGYASQINDLAVSIVSSSFNTTINMAIVQYTKS